MEWYKNFTHLILDEVHENEKITDFLLIIIRDAIKANPHLKVILMSATLNSEELSRYFNNCPVINVPGKMYDVEAIYLDALLVKTEFESDEMKMYMNMMKNDVAQTTAEAELYDECLTNCLDQDDSSHFDQIFILITEKNLPVDHVHTTRMRSALGIPAQKGFYNALEKLLDYKADPSLKDPHGKTALNYAQEYGKDDCYELLLKALKEFKLNVYNESKPLAKKRDIDHQLLNHVLFDIHTKSDTDESILVFLPGYNDIMHQMECIESRFAALTDYELFVLHSGVDGCSNAKQTRVFDRMPRGTRKIILSTNIAETSLTINDVVSFDIYIALK